ncbi:MAG: hypothetical protein AAGA42_15955 [Actinomycetota bacterium]
MTTDPTAGATMPRRRGRRPKVDLDQIVELGAKIGLAELTMSALARKLGIHMTTLYGHVGNLQELRDRVGTRLLANFEVPDDPQLDARGLAIEFAMRLRSLMQSNPGLAEYVMSTLNPSVHEHHDEFVNRLVGLGVERSAAYLLADDIPGFVLSYDMLQHRVMITPDVAPVDQAGGNASVTRDGLVDPWNPTREWAGSSLSGEQIFEWTLRAHVDGVLAAIDRGDMPWDNEH